MHINNKNSTHKETLMSKQQKETLVESMRRYSNIVTEAQQLDEINPFRALDALDDLGKNASRLFSKKPKRTPGLQNVTAEIIEDVIASVPVETSVKIDRMNRMGLRQDAQVKLMEIANSYLDKINFRDSPYIDLAVTWARNDMKDVLKMTFDADVKPKEISNSMLKVLRGYEEKLDLPPNFTRELYLEAVDQYQEKLLDFDYRANQFYVPMLIISSYGALIVAVASIGNIDYNSPRSKAMRQARQDQDFYGADDDAQLSQGEQGYRDQDLLWGDDNDDPNKY